MTCYVIFYAIHPILNKIIAEMSQRTLLKNVIVLCGIYVLLNYIKQGSFFYSNLVLWIVVYFMIAYMKSYMKELLAKKINLLLLVIGIVGNYGIVILTNILGLKVGYLSDKLLHWNVICSPFIILIAVSLLNLAKSAQYVNPTINKVSALSMLIYIIHENIIIRTYARPFLWEWIYRNLGYKYILLWVILCTLGIFILAIFISLLWKMFIQKYVKRISEKLYLTTKYFYNKMETRLNIPSD